MLAAHVSLRFLCVWEQSWLLQHKGHRAGRVETTSHSGLSSLNIAMGDGKHSAFAQPTSGQIGWVHHLQRLPIGAAVARTRQPENSERAHVSRSRTSSKGGAPKGGEPKISFFSFPPPAIIFFLLSLLGSFRGIFVVFEALKCARLEFSGCRVLRRGWVTTRDGWVQIIRGPRPPAERWPQSVRAASAGASKPWQQVQGQASVGRWRQSEKPRSSVPRSHDCGCEEEGGRSQLLQKWAQTSSSRTSHSMLSQIEAFVERARKRFQEHDAAATRARVGRGRRSILSVAGSCSDTGCCWLHCTRGSIHSDAGPIVATNCRRRRDVLVEELHGPGCGSACPRRIFPRLCRPCQRDSSRSEQLDFGSALRFFGGDECGGTSSKGWN